MSVAKGRPTVGRPAVTMSGIAAFLLTTSVKGPGQKRRASSPAETGHVFANRRAIGLCVLRFVDGGVGAAEKARDLLQGTLGGRKADALRPFLVAGIEPLEGQREM